MMLSTREPANGGSYSMESHSGCHRGVHSGGSNPDVKHRLQRLWPYWTRLTWLALRRGAARDDAEDAASSTLLKVATAQGFDDDISDPWPYLATTLRTVMADANRRALRNEPPPLWDESHTEQSPEDQVISLDLVVRLLVRLSATEPPATRMMIIERALFDTSWEEIGEHHGLSASAARSRVDRALGRLRSWHQRRSE